MVKYCKRIQGLQVYNKIWTTSNPFDPYTKDITDTVLVYNVNGKYMEFLKCLYHKDSKKYPFYDQISLSGGGYIPPVTVANFQKMTLLYYHSDTNYREMIVPIHYFSMILNELSRRNLITL